MGKKSGVMSSIDAQVTEGFFFLFCRILSELHVSVQKTLDEDRLQLSRDTINAILSYKKSLETPANRK